ncbi:MAG: orotidine-5'-phosphate decarboxylase [Gammaproteobacteria bacterium]|nr:orotidine-5'-phosphate decarboxylase [Gammaproteobacteria bacterium]
MKNVTSPVVVALDYADSKSALKMASQLNPADCRVKVGKELFTAEGPAVVEALHKAGFEIFLDLKFHDIPATVGKACRAAAELGVWMVNVHASGGSRMMEAAREAVDASTHQPLLIAVTVLTSMDQSDLSEIGISVSPIEQVKRLASLAKKSGMDGVVCSAQEAQMLRQEIAAPFALVTPGIRPLGADAGDQRRILTPSQAKQVGVDYMVIGRPITQAADPQAALGQILQELGNQ